MKHTITFWLLLLFSLVSCAQNIVPNYSFEEADSCPTNFNDRSYEYSLGCVGWGQATSGTADYYSACDTTAISIGKAFPIVGVPYNATGHQDAYQGVAYAGIATYYSSIPHYKEYLITNIPALEVDTPYEVTIHVSLADYCQYASDALGVLFTTYGSPNPYFDTTLNILPQIDYSSYGVIADTTNWTSLSGTFVADSGYTTLIIGAFKDYQQMNFSVSNNNPTSNPPNASYYYIDNVVVQKLSSTGIKFLGNRNEGNIYPNPFTDHATLIFNNPTSQNCTFMLFNVQGQQVKEVIGITSGTARIERDGLPPGFYYYHLSDEKNIIAIGRVIIR